MHHDIQILIFEDDNITKQVFLSIYNSQNRQMSIGVRHMHRAVIEFLFFEGYSGDEIAICLQNTYGQDTYCRAVYFDRKAMFSGQREVSK
jgi:hypothetical protein